MNTPETIYHQLLDSFTSSHVCFALYRLPWTDEPILIMQEEGEPEYIHSLNELNQKKGFLLSPFQFTPAHPAVLIRPDIQAHDWEDIKSALQGWMTRHPQQAAPSHSIDASTNSHITSEKEEKDLYTETFSRFILPLKEKQFRKLVLSRSTTHTLNEQFSPLSAFIQACNSYPRMMISLCHQNHGKGTIYSPCRPVGSSENRFPFLPERYGSFRRCTARITSLQTEPHNRLFYSGIIGWIDPEGDTTLYVNLRCMHIEGKTATLYAGGGILPESTADTEWEETQQKMNTMRNIL